MVDARLGRWTRGGSLSATAPPSSPQTPARLRGYIQSPRYRPGTIPAWHSVYGCGLSTQWLLPRSIALAANNHPCPAVPNSPSRVHAKGVPAPRRHPICSAPYKKPPSNPGPIRTPAPYIHRPRPQNTSRSRRERLCAIAAPERARWAVGHGPQQERVPGARRGCPEGSRVSKGRL